MIAELRRLTQEAHDAAFTEALNDFLTRRRADPSARWDRYLENRYQFWVEMLRRIDEEIEARQLDDKGAPDYIALWRDYAETELREAWGK